MSARPNVDPTAHEPRYGTLDVVPLAGPDAGVGPDMNTGGVRASQSDFPDLDEYSDDQKRAALHWAENTIERKINRSRAIEVPDELSHLYNDLAEAANFLATAALLVPSGNPAQTFNGQSNSDSASGRREVAQWYYDEGMDIVYDLDGNPDLSNDDDLGDPGDDDTSGSRPARLVRPSVVFKQ